MTSSLTSFFWTTTPTSLLLMMIVMMMIGLVFKKLKFINADILSCIWKERLLKCFMKKMKLSEACKAKKIKS